MREGISVGYVKRQRENLSDWIFYQFWKSVFLLEFIFLVPFNVCSSSLIPGGISVFPHFQNTSFQISSQELLNCPSLTDTTFPLE